MKMERVRFVLQKLYRKRIEKYCVWTGQCEGFVHHHFRATHPDLKKLWYERHFVNYPSEEPNPTQGMEVCGAPHVLHEGQAPWTFYSRGRVRVPNLGCVGAGSG